MVIFYFSRKVLCMASVVLIINAGSSSLKFSLYRNQIDKVNSEFELYSKGLLQGIGSEPHLKIIDDHDKTIHEQSWTERKYATLDARDELLDQVLQWIFEYTKNDQILAIGHRVVHGGMKHYRPVIIDQKIYDYLDSLTPFVPLHQPASLSPMKVIMDKYPTITQVACFDTAFHATMPDKAKRFALPRKYYNNGLRRYGFHGLSYHYIVHYLQQNKSPLIKGKLIVAHLGNGSSVAAIYKGKSIDTSMSFTPLDGLVMGTRTGQIDPNVVLYMTREEKRSPDEIEDIIWKQSGLLGVSEVSSDMRGLIHEIAQNGPKAKFAKQAMDLFIYKLIGEIGRLIVSLKGIDGLIFTAGIGAHATYVRSVVCQTLSWLGIDLDEQANKDGSELISTPESKIQVYTLPTNEELIILKEIENLLNSKKRP